MCNAELVDGTLTTGSSGIITFENLHPGVQYRLTELEAPAGYVLLSDNVDLNELPTDNFVEEVTVYNTSGYTIPATGVEDPLYGMTALGAFVTVLTATALLLVMKKKKGYTA